MQPQDKQKPTIEEVKIPWKQRLESLRRTWKTRKPFGLLIGSTVGYRPDPIFKNDGRMHTRRNDGPDEYVRKLEGRKIDHMNG